MRHVISWSGGKDSTATVILMHEHQNEILKEGDEVIILFAEVMFDKKHNVSGHNPDIIRFIYEKKKIFDDYLAFDIMGWEEYEKVGQLIEHEYVWDRYDPAYAFKRDDIKETLDKYIAPIPLSRAAFAEKELKRFAGKNKVCQYVILGAGLDTFAFRNDNPNIKIYELDHPDTQKYKLEKIRALEWNIPENVNYVPVDFATEDMREKLFKV